MTTGTIDLNVALHLVRSARAFPGRAAVLAPRGASGSRARDFAAITFAELDQRCDAIAHGFVERGLVRGDRVAVFVPPGPAMIALVFALFKLGAVPVMLDPGMGRASLVACLARMRPRAFVGVPRAHVLRRIHARALSSIEIDVVVGRKLWPGQVTLRELARPSYGSFACAPTRADETAAILFTSGSTGPPKGVVYAHGMFDAQIRALKAMYSFEPLERDLACFPLFALFDAALGTTCVFPRMDFTRPAECDPAAIASAILEHGCTYGFASPSVWRRVVPWAVANGVRFPTLTRALVAGAPVPPSLVTSLRALVAEHGDVHVAYGATECLPVSSICGTELDGGVRALVEGGHGSCVGRTAPGIEVEILGQRGTPGDHGDVSEPGHIGEIAVRGDVVTREYAEDSAATAAAKIHDGAAVWHRTGDAGYVDANDRLWTVGRVAHGIETRTSSGQRRRLWPVPLENVCDAHPRARRTALVGAGRAGDQRPCLVIEPATGAWPRSESERAKFRSEMQALLRARWRPGSPAEASVPERVLFHRRFPVDVRHNAKIRREDLSAWASATLGAPVS